MGNDREGPGGNSEDMKRALEEVSKMRMKNKGREGGA